MSTRRATLLALGALAAAARSSVAAEALAQRIRRIGYLSLSKSDNEVAQISRSLLRESLRRSGWEEGRNLAIEWRYAEGEVSRLNGLADDLVRLEVELILAFLITPIASAKRATSNIPIVMIGAALPVELGFVQSLAHPGFNVTGTAASTPENSVKAIQILQEAVPSLTRLAILSHSATTGQQVLNAGRVRAANALGVTVQIFYVVQADDVTAALERIAASRVEMLLIGNDGVTESRLRDIASFAIQHKIVSIGLAPQFTRLGGAMYYGVNRQEIVDRSVSFVDRILRGAKPADLPVEEPTKFDLTINLKTMRALGITIPQSMLLRADEVIE